MQEGGLARVIGWLLGPGARGGQSPWVSALSLVIANLIVVVGVLAYGWDVFAIMFLYWAENVIVGAFNVLRMALAAHGGCAKLFMIPFFCVHYGMFCFVHGLFVIMVFGGGIATGHAPSPVLNAIIDRYFSGHPQQVLPLVLAYAPGLGVPLVLLIISRGVSFVYNYLLQGEFLRADASTLMGRPYSRIIVLHIGLIAGAFLTTSTGSSRLALSLLIVAKTFLDLIGHFRDRLAPADGAPAVSE